MKKSIFWFLILGLLGPHLVVASPPPGFQNIMIISTGLDVPTGFDIAPDGRIFIIEQSGKIKIYKNGTLLSQIFDELPAFADSDRGLLGIAFDPDFNSNHFVYFYYIGFDLAHRVVRYDASLDVATNPPVEIYNSHEQAGSNHAGGTIAFGPDGKLYVSIGEGGNSQNAQNLSNPMGKILRLNKDGTIPIDNPFAGQSGKAGEIWAYGFRNPFRFQFDPVSGKLYLGDVGEATWEEINIVTKGGNYGWPLVEGMCDKCSYINPGYVYHHDSPGYSVTGGPVYQGKLFFGDYAKGFIKIATLDGAGNITSVADFEPQAGSVVDLKVDSEGTLYYLDIFPGELHKIVFNNGNQSPIAKASADVSSGLSPLTVNFSSVGSKDPENSPLTFDWDFGDGTHSSESNPQKIYNSRGMFLVQLKVNDGVNTTLANSLLIEVGQLPTLTINSPAEGSTYKASDTISYSAQSKDYQGSSLADTAFTTEVVFHHNTHIHPFIRPHTSRQGSFTIPSSGESDPDTWYEIKISAKDKDNLITTKSINIRPQLSSFNLQTNPAGLDLNLDGRPISTPTTIKGVVNFKRTLDAPDQEHLGRIYEFDHWSDGQSKVHTIATPSSSTTYTAYFRPAEPFKGEYFNNLNLSGSPVLTRNDNLINFIWNSGSPDEAIASDGFSIRWSKSQSFTAGTYRFTTSTDDGVRLYIDNQLIIDKWIDQGETAYSTDIDLTAGDHLIKMEYYDAFGGAVAKLNWTQISAEPMFEDFKAEFYANKNLSGAQSLVRNDKEINFTWNTSSPASGLPSDLFSARWTKTEQLEGRYQFVLTADDGVRLFIDNQLVLDKWFDQPATTYVIQKSLSAGDHEIKLEYYEAYGGAVAKLSYEKISSSDFQSEYYTNKNLFGSPQFIRAEPNINFDWGPSAPDPRLPANQFSVRWTKIQNFSGGTHKFTVTADDGVRLYLDGEIVLDKWIDQPSTTYTIQKDLSGDHEIKLEYYEAYGGAVAKLKIE